MRKGIYKDFNDFIYKNPDKIHFLELKEATCCLIAENKDYLKKNRRLKEELLKENQPGG
jgi:hypothetical protein